MPSGKRSPHQRSVSFSCAKSLVVEIDDLAQAEKRTRSNWIVKELEKLVAQRKAAGIHALPMAAEEEGEYKTKRAIKPRDTVR